MTNTTSTHPHNHELKPSILTIFGIAGNLSKNKLLPALYHLLKRNMLPKDFVVIGITRNIDSASIDKLMQQIELTLLRRRIDVDPIIMDRLKNAIQLVHMDSTIESDYHQLKKILDEHDKQSGISYQRLFYLAIPPSIFPKVITCLRNSGLHDESDGTARRILVEKPFGTNLETARELVKIVSETFTEHQIYRIDHYLAKENAQNILTFRFNNPLVEDIWGRQFIDHIQISMIETIGVDSRSNFYEGMGAMRDIVQSHLLQLMALVMMEVPQKMTSTQIHIEKLALLNAVQEIKPTHVDELTVRGQYEGYKEEVGNLNSKTETFAALALEVANSRWGGVPVLLRTGKSLKKQFTEINVVFKDRSRRSVPANILTIRIQPNEGISIKMTAKKPGFKNELQPVNMDFKYQDNFDEDEPDAYERVLVDCITGDLSLFASNDEVLRCWEILETVIENWEKSDKEPIPYKIGSWGPTEADQLATSFGSEWLHKS